MIEILKLPGGGTCATCRWGDKKGSGVCRKPIRTPEEKEEFEKAFHSPVQGAEFALSNFYGAWCLRWEPSKTYVKPPEGHLRYPAFVGKDEILVFCPGCETFVSIERGNGRGRIDQTHESRCPVASHDYFADVLGKVRGVHRQLKRVCDAREFLDGGANTREYRLHSKEYADQMVRSYFLGWGSSPSDTFVRELLRYMAMGERYPFPRNPFFART